MSLTEVVFTAPSPDQRQQTFYLLLSMHHTLAEIETWDTTDWVTHSLAINDELHFHQIHADLTDAGLRIRPILKVREVREQMYALLGRTITNADVVKAFRAEFPNAFASDLTIDGQPEFCLVDNWSRFGWIVTDAN